MCYSIIPQWRVLSPGAEYNSAPPPKILNLNFGKIIYLFILSFFMPGITSSQTDTLVCDNGGFEEGFKYYTAAYAYYQKGSNDCFPFIDSAKTIPSVFTQINVPAFRRFTLMTGGNDPLTGNSRTKFGQHSLLLNNLYSHVSDDICDTYRDINKIIKRFRVTESTRNFAVWFSVVLELPSGHDDSQPYFNITCDKAPSNDFCFDAESVSSCKEGNPGDSCIIDGSYVAINWTCHKIYIPEDQIGSIATLEISAADCGCGAHFGYAYIDGICEACDDLTLGSGTITKDPYNPVTGIGMEDFSCAGDTLTICGSYTTPLLCNIYTLDSFNVPFFNVIDKSINQVNKTFCFSILRTEFQSQSCRDLYVQLFFKYGGARLPAINSNLINICASNFKKATIEVDVSNCYKNSNDNNYSDDYYFVTATINCPSNLQWKIERLFDDPYSGETGLYPLRTGYGSTEINLYEFLIQEGSWKLIFTAGYCTDTIQITPPYYCSGCNQLSQAKISNVTCHNSNTWSYDLTVGGTPPQGSYYKINGEFIGKDFGQSYTINAGNISQNCIDLVIHYYLNDLNICDATLKICPPKPCTDNANCNYEAYIESLNCLNNGTYSINFITKNGGFPCFKAIGTNTNSSGSFANPLGPFNEDVTITLLACTTPSDCSCTNTNCYKMFFIDKPDDCPREPEGRTKNNNIQEQDEIFVLPNPVNTSEFLIRSKLVTTNLEIYNSSGVLLKKLQFNGSEFRTHFDYSQGVYYLRYINSKGKVQSLKIIKL
ncbi:MAG: T9SS type A sorting domain-containing protein [Saprospiraceae bacterium]